MKIYKTHFSEKESDITIISESKKAILAAKRSFYLHRGNLEKYVIKNPQFLTSLSPIKQDSDIEIIKLMAEVAYVCDVGPMAAVAGALVDLMLETMKLKSNKEIAEVKVALVENGGEIAIDSIKPMNIALYAGNNKLNLNIGFRIEKKDCPIGIGTSSATIGHAISFGEADAVTIFTKTAALADAAATKVANSVKGTDIEKSIKIGLDLADDIDGVIGAFISRKNKIGYTGQLPKLIKIEGNKKLVLQQKLEDLFPGDYEVFK